MAKFRDFFTGSRIAVWLDAIGSTLEGLDDQRRNAKDSISLRTVTKLQDMRDRVGYWLDTKPGGLWEANAFRTYLQTLMQAFVSHGGTRRGVNDVFEAVTDISPVIRTSKDLPKWTLGYQHIMNPAFRFLDAFVQTQTEAPWTFTTETNRLTATVDGVQQTIHIPVGTYNRDEFIDYLNHNLANTVSVGFGNKIYTQVRSANSNSHIQLDTASTCLDVLGWDTVKREALDGSNWSLSLGTFPINWTASAVTLSSSVPGTVEATTEQKSLELVATPGPYTGVLGQTLINDGFEGNLDQWVLSAGSQLHLSSLDPKSGSVALSTTTRKITEYKDGNPITVLSKDIITSQKKPIGDGATVTVNASHKANSVGTLLSGSGTYRWTVTNQVYGFLDGQANTTPVESESYTIAITDNTVNFVQSGIQPGMAVHAQDGLDGDGNPVTYNGKIVAVQAHKLFIDYWRNKKDGGVTNPPFKGTATVSATVLDDATATFTDFVQGSTNYDEADKLLIREKIKVFGRVVGYRNIIRNISPYFTDTSIFIDPPIEEPPTEDCEYFIYTRPSDTTAYTVWSSLEDIPEHLGDETLRESAKITYTLNFYGAGNQPISSRPRVYRPSPVEGNYTTISSAQAAPAGARAVELEIAIEADNAGYAIVNIDDISVTTSVDQVTELDISTGDVMQKIPVSLRYTAATKTLNLNTIPPVTRTTLTLGNTRYWFDDASLPTQYRDEGYFTITSTPTTGDTVTIVGPWAAGGGNLTKIFEFNSLSGGTIGVLASSAATARTNLAAAINRSQNGLSSHVYASVLGNNVLIQARRTNESFTLSETSSTITVTNTDIPSVSVPLATDVIVRISGTNTYKNLVEAINKGSEIFAVLVGNTIQLTARRSGTYGNGLAVQATTTAITWSGTNYLSGGSGPYGGIVVPYAANPSDGTVLALNGTIFQFITSATPLDGARIITIETDVEDTMTNLVNAVNAAGVAEAFNHDISKTLIFVAKTQDNITYSSKYNTSATLPPDVSTAGTNAVPAVKVDASASGTLALCHISFPVSESSEVVKVAVSGNTPGVVQNFSVTLDEDVPAGVTLCTMCSSPDMTGDVSAPELRDWDDSLIATSTGGSTLTTDRLNFYYWYNVPKLLAGTKIYFDATSTNTFTSNAKVTVFFVSNVIGSKDPTGSGNSNTATSVNTLTSASSTSVTDGNINLLMGCAVTNTTTLSIDTSGGDPGYTLAFTDNASAVNHTVWYKQMTPKTGAGVAAADFADITSITATELATYLNARLEGITADTVTIGTANPALRLTTDKSGPGTALIVGSENMNPILGFTDGHGEKYAEKSEHLGWKLTGFPYIHAEGSLYPKTQDIRGSGWSLLATMRASTASNDACYGNMFIRQGNSTYFPFNRNTEVITDRVTATAGTSVATAVAQNLSQSVNGSVNTVKVVSSPGGTLNGNTLVSNQDYNVTNAGTIKLYDDGSLTAGSSYTVDVTYAVVVNWGEPGFGRITASGTTLTGTNTKFTTQLKPGTYIFGVLGGFGWGTPVIVKSVTSDTSATLYSSTTIAANSKFCYQPSVLLDGAEFTRLQNRYLIDSISGNTKVVFGFYETPNNTMTAHLSDPVFIDEASNSLILGQTTIIRNKQREYKAARVVGACAEAVTNYEKSALGSPIIVQNESLVFSDNVAGLANQNLQPHSEYVYRDGVRASGYLYYQDNPTDGDTVTIGPVVFEFDDNASVTSGNIAVDIDADVTITFDNLVTQVLAYATVVEPVHQVAQKRVLISAFRGGSEGNYIPFAESSSTLIADPQYGHLVGGENGRDFRRGYDYEIEYVSGRVVRLPNSRIPDASDVRIDYAYSTEYAITDGLPAQIGPLGVKLEESLTPMYAYCGLQADFDAGTKTNMSVVTRSPDRFTFLTPTTDGKIREVVTMNPGSPATATLSRYARTDLMAVLLKDGVPIPRVPTGGGSGWDFTDESTVTLTQDSDGTYYSSSSVYEFEYYPIISFESAAVEPPEYGYYIFVPSSYATTILEDSYQDMEHTLRLSEKRQATLPVSAVTDQTLAEVRMTAGGQTTVLLNRDWAFINETTVEVSAGVFREDAVFTILYKSAYLSPTSLVKEEFYYRADPLDDWIPVNRGDSIFLNGSTYFRVVVSGDFASDQYRFNSFGVILDSAVTTSTGFGLTPFGKYPIYDIF